LRNGFALLCIISVGFTSFLAMDMQAGLETQFLSETGLNLTHSTFMDFLTFFSIPNIPGSFLGGYLVNWMTHQKGAVFFMLMAFTGQLLGTVGAKYYWISLMFIGRMIFGLAIEIANITVFAYIVQWFRGSMYNFAFAMSVALARLGTCVTIYGSPVLADYMLTTFGPKVNANSTDSPDGDYWTDHDSIVFVYAITTASILISLAGVVTVLFMEPPSHEDTDKEAATPKKTLKESTSKATMDRKPVTSGWLAKTVFYIESAFYTALEIVKRLKFTVACWLVILVCMIFYSAVEPWIMSAKMSFEQYHGVPEKPVPGETVNRSALLTTLLSAVPIIGCPIMGIVIDKYQCNAVWTTLGSFVSIAGHILLMAPQWLSEATPFWLLVVANCLLGAGYCMLASSIWTLLSYTVTDADSNIAYGMIQSMQHIGFIIASKSDGAIIEASTIFSLDSYFWLEVFFSGVHG